MADHTNIEWTDATWQVVTGCDIVSPGCTNCYAMKMAGTRLKTHPSRAGLTTPSRSGPVWTGEVRFNEQWLDRPLRWRKPRRIFVAAHGDLFHPGVPDEVLDKVFAVMALARHHTFQCLTKRPNRARAYLSDAGITHRVSQAIDAILVDREHGRDPEERWSPVLGWESYEASTHGRVRRNGELLAQTLNPLYGRPSVTLWRDNEPTTVYVHKLVLLAHRGPAKDGDEARHRNGNREDNRLANLEWSSRADNQADKVRHGSNGGPAKITRQQAAEIRALRRTGQTQQSIANEYGVSRSLVSMIESRKVWPDAFDWPLPNVWLGVSVEDQQRADERIPHLLATPAAKRFVSAEPLLGPVNLREITRHIALGLTEFFDSLTGERAEVSSIFGGTFLKGDEADPDVETFGSKLDCVIVGGESQAGARPMHPDWARSLRDQCAEAGVAFHFKQWGEWVGAEVYADGNIGGLTRSQMPDGGAGGGLPTHWWSGDAFGGVISVRVGKKAAGRLLDGRTHDEVPG